MSNSSALPVDGAMYSAKEEETVFGITLAAIECMQASLNTTRIVESRWCTGGGTKMTDFQNKDGRKELFRQRFNRLRDNVIQHKN